ncbi:hypothetical protein CEXT_566521 [Caerostris extrusa]|uniref:Uncharacterized protein n=1 Tax=Caerostris extrusa TaxID=172846 RepID=A0AAV4WZB4_CAEEX|nr:hypothetical protein CEXT_566521 [Caerostris extrusa]
MHFFKSSIHYARATAEQCPINGVSKLDAEDTIDGKMTPLAPAQGFCLQHFYRLHKSALIELSLLKLTQMTVNSADNFKMPNFENAAC